MSKAKRWHRSINLEGVTRVYEVVLASDYEAAQSELAALREELAEWKARSGRRTAERTQFMNERDEYKQANALLIESCAEKFDLLTAAEQRNAEHIKVLLTFASCADVRRVGTGAMDYVAKLGAFKPTESGASVDKCSSCFGTGHAHINGMCVEGTCDKCKGTGHDQR